MAGHQADPSGAIPHNIAATVAAECVDGQSSIFHLMPYQSAFSATSWVDRTSKSAIDFQAIFFLRCWSLDDFGRRSALRRAKPAVPPAQPFCSEFMALPKSGEYQTLSW
jgi:hypothetical protein